ncbi:restriction endonuclease subunit S [Vibrio owensii]|uniref:restriction endonuclease subunit S n=1 Tax=Vibrio owensii TaxID=696485 RepID=UPI0022DD0061|nr:restriction endonuclease subunit S [Vibrio owensii]MDA0382950.1 restriction endonuclease subunit S [Vibrio owensii]
MNKLPLGWFSVNTGLSFTQISTTKLKVKSKDTLNIGIYPVVDQGAEFIAGYVDDESKVIYVNNPLCIFGDHTRAIKWIDFVPGADGTKVLVPASYLFPKFFYYQLKTLEIEDRGYSRHFKYLKATNFKVAPLNEQIRIANKLDSILAKVDKAQAHLDKIPAILKRFRQSVLAAATSGELTKEWREEMGFTKDTWLPTSIDSLSVRAFDGPFGSKLKTADYTDNGIKVARLENVGHLVFNSEKQTFISETKYQELVKNTIEHNDVLFSSFVDEEIRTCLFDERLGTHINKADCFCIRPNQEIVHPEFLMYSLACKHTYEKIKKQVHGATRPRVNLRFLKSFEIALPSPKEQSVVVDKINQLFSKTNKVEQQYLDAKARLDRLTQSILAKAFRGELVPQDPNDEPAEKLLERIVAEKEQNKSKKTTRKRTTKAKTAEKE